VMPDPPSRLDRAVDQIHAFGARLLDRILEELDALPRGGLMTALGGWYVPPNQRRGRRWYPEPLLETAGLGANPPRPPQSRGR
jgi:hypothetical protein